MRGEGEDFFQMGRSSVLSGGRPMGGIDFDGRDVSKKIVRWEGGGGGVHTINILKLCRHSGITSHSITHSLTLIKKELKACAQYFLFVHQMMVLKVRLSNFKKFVLFASLKAR